LKCSDETKAVLEVGKAIAVGGIPGVFELDLKRLEALLDDVSKLLIASDMADVDIESLLQSLAVIK